MQQVSPTELLTLQRLAEVMSELLFTVVLDAEERSVIREHVA